MLPEISEAFRTGQDNKPIVVKFANHTSKKKMYSKKKLLKDKTQKYYINEDLTKNKSQLLKKARDLRNELYIWKIWTLNATIYYTINPNDENEKPKTIINDSDIEEIKKKVKPRTK